VTLKGEGRDPNMFWAHYLKTAKIEIQLQWSAYGNGTCMQHTAAH